MIVDDVRAILGLLSREAASDLSAVWANADPSWSSADFRAYVEAAFPELVLPYSAAAADVGVEMYETAATTSDGFVAVEGDLPSAERLSGSARWALDAGMGDGAVALLSGAADRAILDGLRDTITTNVGREPGARWARYASATACPFCRMLATRDDYLSESTAGFKSHDNCHCIPTPIRPGGDVDRPAYVDRWKDEYQQARKSAGSGDPKAIVAAWGRLIR